MTGTTLVALPTVPCHKLNSLEFGLRDDRNAVRHAGRTVVRKATPENIENLKLQKERLSQRKASITVHVSECATCQER